MSKRILIAGAGGAVGCRLCPLLVADGWQVAGTTRSAAKVQALQAMGVAPVVVDVFDEAALHRAVADAAPDIVVHQLTDLPLGLEPVKMVEAGPRNAHLRDIGTRNLVAAAVAAGAKRMVAQSVAFVYAPGPMPYREDAPLNVDAPDRAGVSARGAASLERHVLEAPLESVILRYGRFYGPGTGVDTPPIGVPLHVDGAADAARRAVTRGSGIYNVVEEQGTVCSSRATDELGWQPGFRID
jgi:nucleoside-diphosphate-sugar epimerase